MTTYSKLLLFAATLSAAALLASTTSSCTKSDETEATGSRKAAPGAVRTETVSIAIEDDEATKTTFDPSSGAFSWQSGDKIGVQVYNTSTGAITYKECTINTTDASARFTVTLAENEVRGGWCYYPSNIAASPTTSLASTSITLPSSYDNYVSGYAPTPMYAINDPRSSKLYFSHLGGVLRLSVTAPSDMQTADKIVVTLTGGNIAGAYTASYAGFYQIPSGGSSTSVTYNLASSLAANGSQVVFVPVPTGVSFTRIRIDAFTTSTNNFTAVATQDISITTSRAHGKQLTAALSVPSAAITGSLGTYNGVKFVNGFLKRSSTTATSSSSCSIVNATTNPLVLLDYANATNAEYSHFMYFTWEELSTIFDGAVQENDITTAKTISGKTVRVPTKEEFENLISTTRGGSYGSTINGSSKRYAWSVVRVSLSDSEAATGTDYSNKGFSSSSSNTSDNYINGILFFPDGATITCSDIVASNCNSNTSDIWNSPSTITSAQLSTLVRGGCMFLPAVGSWIERGTYGHYWAATFAGNNEAWSLDFHSNYFYTYNYERLWSFPVVLVQD